jgi:hypothetical protein
MESDLRAPTLSRLRATVPGTKLQGTMRSPLRKLSRIGLIGPNAVRSLTRQARSDLHVIGMLSC